MKNNTSAKQASDGRPDRGALARKDFDVEIKAIDEATGEFELYCAVFGNVDRQGDVIAPGAFKNLAEFIISGWVTTNHQNYCLPLAYVDTATQDGHGLKITGRFHSTPEAQACRTVVAERMAAGKAVKCSFGYRILDSAVETRNGDRVNVLKALEIYEASIVNMPANPAAEVTRVKSEKDLISIKDIDAYIERLKAGRVISSANHQKLKDFAKGLMTHGKAAMEMAKGLKEFLASHGPMDDDEDGPEDKPEDGGDSEDEDGDEVVEKPKKKPTSKQPEKSDQTLSLKRRSLVGRVAVSQP